MLTEADIKLIGQTLGTRIPGASDYSSWPGMGYEKDVDGRYTVPCFPAIGYPFARAIESAACAERDARIAELTRELEEARRKATEDAYEFNRAINFAIEQGLEACHFLAAWREGDPSGWPEFDAAIKEQT